MARAISGCPLWPGSIPALDAVACGGLTPACTQLLPLPISTCTPSTTLTAQPAGPQRANEGLSFPRTVPTLQLDPWPQFPAAGAGMGQGRMLEKARFTQDPGHSDVFPPLFPILLPVGTSTPLLKLAAVCVSPGLVP